MLGQAMARGYQADKNRKKELDSDLIEGMVDEVEKLILEDADLRAFIVGGNTAPTSGSDPILDEESKRGTGRTREQLKNAPRNAIFVWANNINAHYAVALAASLGRHDLSVFPLNILSNAEVHKIRGYGRTGVIVIDHDAEVKLTDAMRSNLKGLEYKVVYYTPPKNPVPLNPEEPLPVWSAEPSSWNPLNGNFIDLRTPEGKPIAKLHVRVTADEASDSKQAARELSEKVAKDVCRMLDHRSNYRTADIAPRHVVNTSARPALARIESAMAQAAGPLPPETKA